MLGDAMTPGRTRCARRWPAAATSWSGSTTATPAGRHTWSSSRRRRSARCSPGAAAAVHDRRHGRRRGRAGRRAGAGQCASGRRVDGRVHRADRRAAAPWPGPLADPDDDLDRIAAGRAGQAAGVCPAAAPRGDLGRDAAVAAAVETFRLIGSRGYPFDEAHVRDIAGRSWDRGSTRPARCASSRRPSPSRTAPPRCTR